MQSAAVRLFVWVVRWCKGSQNTVGGGSVCDSDNNVAEHGETSFKTKCVQTRAWQNCA